ncbi:MAG: hypothetical protein M1834_007778 [Cirrosporium novae-zelandiae]|nr:MAG: hypothetical protein M1834_007778 [Cirrosporium novae-zelandiae]
MARFSSNSQFYTPTSNVLESKPSFVEDDELAVLDDRILDSQPSDLTMMDGSRRQSFEDNTVGLAPRPGLTSDEEAFQECAQQQHFQVQSRQPINTPAPFYFHGQNNPFLPATSQSAAEDHPAAAWAPEPASGSITPTQNFDGLPWEHDRNPTTAFGNAPVTMGDPYSVGGPFRNSSVYSSAMSVTMSPQASNQGWMPEAHHYPKRMRAESPNPYHRASSPILRRDGIRKKNARFEIPAERTLDTIDQLIAQSTDEQEIKELKQQKRLLRNRQAALDSRQRKKQHTEKLEEEKKQSQMYIQQLEEDLESMRVRESEYIKERAQWIEQQQYFSQNIETLQQQREEEIQNYTLQTAELRKKNTFLMEQVQRLENNLMSAAPSSTGFSAEFSDFENLTMENSPWEDFTMPTDFADDTEMQNSPAQFESVKIKKSEPQPTLSKDTSNSKSSSIPPGIWLLLLFGAWVASNNSNTSSSSSPIPRIMDSYRAEATSAIEAVTRSAGVDFSNPSSLAPSSTNTARPSAPAWTEHKTTLSASEIASISNSAPSSLDILSHELIDTKEDQEAAQLFSLTPDQYNSMTTHDPFLTKQPALSISASISHRPNLGEALAAMRGDSKSSSGDVYERSLLWEKVPEDVVRDFRVMVAECNRQQRHCEKKGDNAVSA